MKQTLKLEEWAQFGLSIFAFNLLDFAWWWFPALLLLPDVGMIGYAFGTRIGAMVYNVFHHKALAIIVGLIGYSLSDNYVLLVGIIMFGHASMDRAIGYGLKYPDNFKHTHLGWIGGKSQ